MVAALEEQVQKQYRVLVLEDDRDMPDIFNLVLEAEPVQLYFAPDLKTAYHHIEQGLVPDILLADRMIDHQEEGPQFIKNIQEKFPDCYTVLVSGVPKNDDPGNQFLYKPFGIKELRDAVRKGYSSDY